MKFIFICGLNGDTYTESLKEFCTNKGHEFFAPKMPTFNEGITYDKYKLALDKLIKEENITDFSDVIIIAQSAGTNFIVKYFATSPLNIHAYISCAGFYDFADRDISDDVRNRLKVLDTFFPTKEDYTKFKKLQFKKFSIIGGKDCFFTLKNLKKYATAINSTQIFDPNGVHGTHKENIKTHTLLHKVIEENF